MALQIYLSDWGHPGTREPGALADDPGLKSTCPVTTVHSPQFFQYLIVFSDEEAKKDTSGRQFATDIEISNNWRTTGSTSPRELAKWTPDEGAGKPAVGADFDKEAKLGANWDQFEANQRLFGVATSFDEAIYTTQIDRSAPGFKEREAKAARIAKEILESGGPAVSNIHIAEERGLVAGADYDEEDRYGAVVRSKEADDQLSSPVQMPRSRMSGPRKSITSLNATPESIEVAMHVVSQASETVSRRLSQINEADLNKVLSESGRPRLGSATSANGSSPKPAKELNPDAAEFEPTFSLPTQAAPTGYNQGGNYYRGGGHGYYQQQGYGGYFADPYYGYAAGYYPPEAYYSADPASAGYPTGAQAPPPPPQQ